ncbi:hypothetical protein FA95DRAFT_823866 [Auriscalpium vulgare]|uniref:Uncharacterized protein n=1 Tax=Auriscalpium vulgare TaxID=40419 RepID=A0ACB8RB74_9AGAM|nr:hypothetical protein FA95DRAFT_823866 [Auriscalpium vulgare]
MPALVTLSIADLNFWHSQMDKGRADPLRQWLVERARAGRALRKLRVSDFFDAHRRGPVRSA